MTQVKAGFPAARNTDPMNSVSVHCATKPYCHCSLHDICRELQRLSAQAAALYPVDAMQAQSLALVRKWCDARALSLERLLSVLNTDAEATRLLGDWLAHAPPLATMRGLGSPSHALYGDVAALEEHLLALFGTLMQQGDSAWARQFYSELLENPAPVPRIPPGQGTVRSCPTPN